MPGLSMPEELSWAGVSLAAIRGDMHHRIPYFKIMNPRQRYHSILPFAFYCSLLTQPQLRSIPRSTRYYWHKRNQMVLFDAGLSEHAEHLTTLQAIANHRQLLKLNKALLRAIALTRFIGKNTAAIKSRQQNAMKVVVNQFQKVSVTTGLRLACEVTGIGYRQWLKMRATTICSHSPFGSCRRKHPAQLLNSEIRAIVKTCHDPYCLHWPLASLYYKALRAKEIACSLVSFYKYAALLVKRPPPPPSRRKHHCKGIRSSRPFELIHTDITQFTTANGTRSFIYLVQDNFSRAVLEHRVETERKAKHTIGLIRKVLAMKEAAHNTGNLQILSDDGVENKPIRKVLTGSSLTHLVAQKDISFSNSMIEYLNRTLKYQYLYQQAITTLGDLEQAIDDAIKDYNNRPAHALLGLTPLESLNNQEPDTEALSSYIQSAARKRIILNKSVDCCTPAK